jgi:hypothetical protein
LTCVACSCFDVDLMRGRPGLSMLLLLCAGVWRAAPVLAQGHGDAALGSMLRPVPVRPDDTDQLGQLLRELAERPGANAASAELLAAQRVLADLRQLQAQAAAPAAVERRRQTLWAALLLIDRLEARATYQLALRALEGRVARAEAELARVRSENAQAATLRGSAP